MTLLIDLESFCAKKFKSRIAFRVAELTSPQVVMRNNLPIRTYAVPLIARENIIDAALFGDATALTRDEINEMTKKDKTEKKKERKPLTKKQMDDQKSHSQDLPETAAVQTTDAKYLHNIRAARSFEQKRRSDDIIRSILRAACYD